MGNRATIVTKKKDLGVYVHWFGGREEVEPVVTYCGMRGYRPPEEDGYGRARLSQVFGNHMGGRLSIGVFAYDKLPLAMDNGDYVIEGWRIIEQGGKKYEPLPDDFDMRGKLHEIDEHMPVREQLGAYIDSTVIPIEQVEVGMTIWGWEGDRPKQFAVLGFGPDEADEELRGKPYVNRVKMPDEEYWQSGSNYLLDDFTRIEKPRSWMDVAIKELFGRPISELN